MKKLVFLFFAFSMMQMSGQDLKSLSKSAMSSGTSMIEGLAVDQIKSLTKKLNLNESQQKQASDLVVSQLKSEKFQKLIGGIGGNALTSSGKEDSSTDKIQSALMNDKDFQNGMGKILDEEQMKKMQTYIPK
jgi:hypothetical protein